MSNCHPNALCSDIVGSEGSFQCSCNTGYSGDGVNCNSEFLMYSYRVSVNSLQILMSVQLAWTTAQSRLYVPTLRAVLAVRAIMGTWEMA